MKVADPYRWLEDDKSAETAKWVEAQNAVTFGYLQKIPYRDKIKKRLTDIFNYPRYSSPFRVGEYYLFSKNDGLQNQAVIYIQKGLEGPPEVLIDPNQLSPDGTIRIGLIGFSGDKKYAAISRSESGSDWSEIRVLELSAKKELPDRIQWNKFSGAAWKGNGFYYSGYDKPAPGTELTAKNEFQKVFYHKLGDPQDKDALVYEDKKNPLLYFGLGVSEDERFAFLSVSKGTSGTELYYKDLAKPAMAFAPLIQGFDFDSAAIDNVGDKFLVYTNVYAPNFKVVLIDPKKPAKDNWTTGGCSPAISRTPTPRSISTTSTASSTGRSPFRRWGPRAGSAAGRTTRSFSSRSHRSPSRRRSISMISPPARPRSSARPR
jgi:prolyl oligopeptidase